MHSVSPIGISLVAEMPTITSIGISIYGARWSSAVPDVRPEKSRYGQILT